jgi:hypothetical protein
MAAPETRTRQQIYEEIHARFTRMEVPPCPRCGTSNTASVQVGIVWITIWMASTCPKFKLIPNGPKPGNWFCNTCQKFFDVPYEQTQGGNS